MIERENANLKAAGLTVTVEQLVTESDELAKAILRAVVDVVGTERELVQYGQQVTDRIARVTSGLSGDEERMRSVNPLGEIQSSAGQFDTACARLSAQRATLSLLAGLYKARVSA